MNFTRYQSYIFQDESDLSLTAFSRKSSFATVVKFFNMIGLVLSSSLDLNKSIKIYMLFLLLSAVIDSIQGWIQKLFKAETIGGFICYWIANQVFPTSSVNNQKKGNF